MLALVILGTIVSSLTAVTIFWWTVRLYDVNDYTDSPISTLRSVVGQILIIITSISSAFLYQAIVAIMLSSRWKSTDNTLHANTLLSIASSSTPLLWVYQLRRLGKWGVLDGCMILFTVFLSVIIHIAVGSLQNAISIGYTSVGFQNNSIWLPEKITPFYANLSNPDINYRLRYIVSGTFQHLFTDDDSISVIPVAANFDYNTRHYNSTRHFYYSVPKVNATFLKGLEANYTWINNTHIVANVYTLPSHEFLCRIETTAMVNDWLDDNFWIGCSVERLHYLFYPSNRDFRPSVNGYLNISHSIGYRVYNQCYHHVISPVNYFNHLYKTDNQCDETPITSTLDSNDYLSPILRLLYSAPYSNEQAIVSAVLISGNRATLSASLTHLMWGMNYYIYEREPGLTQRLMMSYERRYYSEGKLSTWWYLILIVPVATTILFSSRAIHYGALLRPYWSISLLRPEEMMDENAKVRDIYF